MGWITKPSALSAEGNLSDYTHITSFYDQMSDGEHDISVSGVECQEIKILNDFNNSNNKMFKFISLNIPDIFTILNLNEIIESYGYKAIDYKNYLVLIQSNNSFCYNLIKSVQIDSKNWKWILISNEGSFWNVY